MDQDFLKGQLNILHILLVLYNHTHIIHGHAEEAKGREMGKSSQTKGREMGKLSTNQINLDQPYDKEIC